MAEQQQREQLALMPAPQVGLGDQDQEDELREDMDDMGGGGDDDTPMDVDNLIDNRMDAIDCGACNEQEGALHPAVPEDESTEADGSYMLLPFLWARCLLCATIRMGLFAWMKFKDAPRTPASIVLRVFVALRILFRHHTCKCACAVSFLVQSAILMGTRFRTSMLRHQKALK